MAISQSDSTVNVIWEAKYMSISSLLFIVLYNTPPKTYAFLINM